MAKKHQIFTTELLKWYQHNARQLPWRAEKKPYEVWLSEIILQQTRMAQGLPYYKRFLAAYPTVQDLANSTEKEVLRLWQGLGYYTRARNLHKCAQHVTTHLKGIFPQRYADLIKLPGIGPYTAAAIASIAFNEPVATIDGNVYRVLARIFGIEKDISLPNVQTYFSALAHSLMTYNRPGDFNQALMEFGALCCTPKKPHCHECPFAKICVANQKQKQHLLPVKGRKVKIKRRYFYYFMITFKDKIFFKKRLPGDIWCGLYDFYLIEQAQATTLAKLDTPLLAAIRQAGIIIKPYEKVYQHQLTHQRITATFFYLEVKAQLLKEIKKTDLVAVHQKEIATTPMPILIVQFLATQYPYKGSDLDE